MEPLFCVVGSGFHQCQVYEEDCHVLSFLCVDQPVITSFSLSDIDSSAPDSVRETRLLSSLTGALPPCCFSGTGECEDGPVEIPTSFRDDMKTKPCHHLQRHVE